MMDNYIILPILVHMFTAIMLVFFWPLYKTQRYISLLGNIIAVVMAFGLYDKVSETGILVMYAGGWKAPFGITFVVDTFSSVMVVLTSLVGLAVCIFSAVGISLNRVQYGYFAILHFLLMGLNGAFITGDIFNLYVWFEIVIISSFVLMTLGGKKPQMEGAIKYVTLNMLASTIFLTAIGILYGVTGTLNMADLSVKVAALENRGLVSVTALLFFVGFGIKSAVFPLYFWLPSSYHTPPSAIAAIFGGLLTKMGIYALLRTFTLIFVPDSFISNVFIVIAFATLLTGAVGTVNKQSIRRVFSYLIVCHIGYMIAGIGLYTDIALTGVIFYLIHDIIVKTNLFMVSGIIYKIRGSTDMRRLGGLYADYPKLSVLMALVFFSLVGIPPLSGFWPKIYLFEAALKGQNYILLAGLIIASFVTLYIIAKIWTEVFWKQLPKPQTEPNDFDVLPLRRKWLMVLPVAGLLFVSLYIGFGAEKIIQISGKIANDMLNTNYYIEAVLGEVPSIIK